MSLLDDLARWKQSGAIRETQYDVIAALVRKDRFPVYTELTALLYLGVISTVAGIGWTIREHFTSLGDVAILCALTGAFVVSIAYCFVRGGPYTPAQQESPEFVFDYVVYFGCLIFGVELGFIEYRYQLLKDSWDHYLLLSSVMYFSLAYRFDNRLVLSLALSTLAGWFGLRLYHLQWLHGMTREYALAYAAVVAMAGVALHRARVKAHFLETYLHVATNVALGALTAGVFDRTASWSYVPGLLLGAALSIGLGVKFRRFAFVVYGVIYTYVGVSDRVVERLGFQEESIFACYAVSAAIVVVFLVILARRFGRDA